jgi:hypothetical protein
MLPAVQGAIMLIFAGSIFATSHFLTSSIGGFKFMLIKNIKQSILIAIQSRSSINLPADIAL